MADELYGPAVASAVRSLRSEPRLRAICRAMRRGILAHEWTRDEPVAAYLGSVKLSKRERAAWRVLGSAAERMDGEQERTRQRYLAVTASAAWTALPEVARRLYDVLYARSGDPDHGGPDVLASVRVLLRTLYDLHGRRYDPKSVTYAWHCLEDAGILTVTPGVSHQGFARARTTVYHLLPDLADDPYSTSPEPGTGGGACGVEVGEEPAALPDSVFLARARMLFSDAVELLRRLWYRVRTRGGTIRWDDLFPEGARVAAPGVAGARGRQVAA